MTAEALPPEVRTALLEMARAAITARLAGLSAPPSACSSTVLDERRGAFVSLRRRGDGDLRGCVGFPEPRHALRTAVPQAALGAAFADHRFAPLRPRELSLLRVEVSVLGALDRVDAADVVAGRHGVLVRAAGRTGLFLPHVAVDHGWDRDALLSWACRKAGLPPDTWRTPACTVEVFTAERFGEE